MRLETVPDKFLVYRDRDNVKDYFEILDLFEQLGFVDSLHTPEVQNLDGVYRFSNLLNNKPTAESLSEFCTYLGATLNMLTQINKAKKANPASFKEIEASVELEALIFFRVVSRIMGFSKELRKNALN